MASIEIRREHSLSKSEAFKRAQHLANEIGHKYNFSTYETADCIHFTGSGSSSGVKGTIEVTGDYIRIAIDLPFLLKLMRGTIEEQVNTQLEQAFGHN